MKKTLITIFIIILLSSFTIAQNKKAPKTKRLSTITKTYELKYVAPRVVSQTLSSYMLRSDYQKNGRMMTVKFRSDQPDHIVQFEKLLKKLDVKKQQVTFRIFTVIASHKSDSKNSIPIKGDLKKVLDELQTIMSFKSFKLDGMSAMTALDGQRHGAIELSSSGDMRYKFHYLRINGTKKGERDVSFEFSLEQHQGSFENKQMWKTLQQSKTSIKEGGYLVAGVSKIGRNGDSLILVINAYIK